MRPADEYTSTGSLTLTVRNAGPVPAAKPALEVILPQGFTATALPSGCAASVTYDGKPRVQCGLSRLAVSATRTVTFDVSTAAGGGTGTVGQYAASVEWGSYPDPASADNYIERPVVA